MTSHISTPLSFGNSTKERRENLKNQTIVPNRLISILQQIFTQHQRCAGTILGVLVPRESDQMLDPAEYNKFGFLHISSIQNGKIKKSLFSFLTCMGFSMNNVVTTPPPTPLYIALFTCLFLYLLDKYVLCVYCVPAMKRHTGYTSGDQNRCGPHLQSQESGEGIRH